LCVVCVYVLILYTNRIFSQDLIGDW